MGNLLKRVMFNFQNIKRFLLSLVFFYFVSMMLVMGNGHSFLGRYLSGFYIPVANSIGLNTTWNFFSPDPANVMYFRYDVIFEDDYGQATQETFEDYFPKGKDEGTDFRLDRRRFAYAMRWLALDPERIRQFFVPMICKEHPKAKKVQIEFIVKPIPPLEKVLALKDENYEDLVQTEELARYVHDCDQSN
jgi:hypothetical protein